MADIYLAASEFVADFICHIIPCNTQLVAVSNNISIHVIFFMHLVLPTSNHATTQLVDMDDDISIYLDILKGY